MPVVTIAGNEISKQEKEDMIKKVTKIVAETYKLPESAITILIQAYPADNVGVGGEQLTNLKK